jgi:tetratricopeptide (TPR) repeat protein
LVEDNEAKESDREEAKRHLAVNFGDLGNVYSMLGKAESSAAYASSVRLSRELSAAHPEDVDYQRDLSFSLRELGERYQATKQTHKAELALQESLQISRELTLCHPERSDWLTHRLVAFLGLSEVMDPPKDLSGRVSAFRQEAYSAEEHLRRYGSSPDLKRALSNIFLKMGDDLLATGKPANAREAIQRAIDIRTELYENDRSPLDTEALEYLYVEMGEAWIADRQPTKALKVSEDWLGLLQRVGRSDGKDMENAFSNVAWYAVLAKDVERAQSASSEASARDRGDTVSVSANRAHALMVAGFVKEARSIYLSNIGRKDEFGKTWENNILKDFKQFRSFGIESDLMREVDKQFSVAPEEQPNAASVDRREGASRGVWIRAGASAAEKGGLRPSRPCPGKKCSHGR